MTPRPVTTIHAIEIASTITNIKTFLVDTFSAIDLWFEKDKELREYRPVNGGWTINEILEHISLTNHFLLILIDKGTKKALQNLHHLDLETELKNQVFHSEKLLEIGLHKSFAWVRPQHMQPKGEKPLREVRNELKEQLIRCLDNLDKLKNGEGVLYKIKMTVNGLGKIDVYEYVYFLGQHGQRHISQMQKNEDEFRTLKTAGPDKLQ